MPRKTKGHTVDNVIKMPILRSVAHRLPWLLIGLLGGILAARVVNSYEETLSQNLYLAAFIPLIVYISDAVGTQMEVFVIRDFAIDNHMVFVRYFAKQTVIVSIIAIVLSASLFGYSMFVHKELLVAITLSVSLFAAVLSSLLTGLAVPYIFNKINFDPANASGPIATIIQDLMSVFVYFTVASWLLG